MKKLWLWRNFVDGKPEYWAFDNPFPINLDNGDPQTLGEPCGYALVKESRNGRPEVSEAEVLRAIKRSEPPPSCRLVVGDEMISVPEEPTEAMLQDGSRAYEAFLNGCHGPSPRNCVEAMRVAWRAMLKIGRNYDPLPIPELPIHKEPKP